MRVSDYFSRVMTTLMPFSIGIRLERVEIARPELEQ